MSRLVTFGCSFTYGHGLSDCVREDNGPRDHPSILGWPNMLAIHLGKELINASTPGASNLEILYHILNFDFKKDDLVIILWSFHSRDTIFTEPEGIYVMPYIPVGPWQTSDLARYWMQTHSAHDLKIRTWFNINHGILYLDNNSIRNYSFSVDIRQYGKKPSYIKINNLDTAELFNIFSVDKAIDGRHPGLASNRLFFEFVSKRIEP